MKNIQVTTKYRASKMQVESLFTPVNGGTLSQAKYCGGNYKPGSFPTGRDVEVSGDIYAIWAESRRDSEGPYVSLYCLTSR
jgi:hypothetical protein